MRPKLIALVVAASTIVAMLYLSPAAPTTAGSTRSSTLAPSTFAASGVVSLREAKPHLRALDARPIRSTASAPSRAAPARAPTIQRSTTPPQPPSGGGYHGSLEALVCSYHWSCAVATCIVSRESRWDTRAYNHFSGAAGLWQWLPAWYHRYGFDPFSPTQATAFAWHRYQQSGWSDWHSSHHPCY